MPPKAIKNDVPKSGWVITNITGIKSAISGCTRYLTLLTSPEEIR